MDQTFTIFLGISAFITLFMLVFSAWMCVSLVKDDKRRVASGQTVEIPGDRSIPAFLVRAIPALVLASLVFPPLLSALFVYGTVLALNNPLQAFVIVCVATAVGFTTNKYRAYHRVRKI